ncbi:MULTISPECIES: tRNA lysidine(34) synthetase TilS [unclassified Pedobacter]|uniref:tRNA lysidine(34) synthetase TilS n=1 Tax=unclassified Pedobacter TaxID=2628915 RepID=UPI001421D0C1|nr:MULTISPECIES: tRNA lysidine(34) synthetase TilS [unclassified Pedobacter]NII85096.1 tRNA(Ile)-lysidine synthase [Pedobacter sp. SG908]NMN37995.1 tRNA(Ile)-lysidine synthase [Pedobacter sp. SG918]
MLPVKQFQDFIEQQQLFVRANKILLAVSGGKDSVLMLHLFKAIGIDVGVAHCNFNLRADEAQRDESFVALLSKNLGLPFYVTHFDTKKYAAENKISTQMAARDLRYNWFEEIRRKEGYDYIALAQHQNDAVETILINLTRGTGISGLHGILPKRDLLIRPLLFLNRQQIDEIVRINNINFVEDSSNASTNYTRNKIRLQVVPHLQEINPNLEKTFAENIVRFAELEVFLNIQVQKLANKILNKRNDGIYIPLEEVLKLNPQKLLLYELLKPFNFGENVVQEILDSLKALSGTHFFSATHQAIINRNDLVIVEKNTSVTANQFIHPTTENIAFANDEISLRFTDEVRFEINSNKAFVNADKLIFPLILRNWQNGDKFIPLGMRNPKKVSDYFIDEKVPLHLKSVTPILVNGNGEIVWIAGMRQDNRYKLTTATKKVAIFELKIK